MPSCSRNCWLFSQVIGWERTRRSWQPWPSPWPSKSSFFEILDHPKHFDCRLLLALDLCPEWVFLHTFSWKTSLNATCHQRYTHFLLENILGCYISSVLYIPSPWRLPWMLRIKTHFDLLVVSLLNLLPVSFLAFAQIHECFIYPITFLSLLLELYLRKNRILATQIRIFSSITSECLSQ